jgi:hypothetical protein
VVTLKKAAIFRPDAKSRPSASPGLSIEQKTIDLY